MDHQVRSNDYHDYVIKDGKFIGDFENMYQACSDPWPETIEDFEANPVTRYTVTILRKIGCKRLFTAGSGKGLHAHWLMTKVPGLEVEGCEISPTAVDYSNAHYPAIKVHCADLREVIKQRLDFDVILCREILWYILPFWSEIVGDLKRLHKGKYIILELSCYDKQSYGLEYFDGPEDIVNKFPFQIKEILRHHRTPYQREGVISVFGQI